jgi:flavin-dependent dehydrogenase
MPQTYDTINIDFTKVMIFFYKKEMSTLNQRLSPVRQIGSLLVNPYAYLRQPAIYTPIIGWFGYIVATIVFFIWGFLFYGEINRSFGERSADWLWSSLYFIDMNDGFTFKMSLYALLTTILFFTLVIHLGKWFGNHPNASNAGALFGASQWQMSLFYIIGIIICPFSLMTSLAWIILISLSNYAVVFPLAFEVFSIREKWRTAFASIVFTLYIALYILLMFVLIQFGSWLDRTTESNASEMSLHTQFETMAHTAEASQYDVIVVGAEPEGISAAISAARNGLHTLLVEERATPGGLLTHGRLNYLDLPQTKGGRIVSAGIFAEWHELMDNANVTDIQATKQSFMKMMSTEPNIDLSLYTEVLAPLKDDNTVVGLHIKDRNGHRNIYAKRLIDASQDADLAAAAGAPYFVGSEDLNLKNRFMAVTPIIHVVGVDWKGIRKAAAEETFGAAYVTHDTVAGFGKLFDMYKPVSPDMRLRGLNMGRVFATDGEHFYINALLIFNVNGLDEQQKFEALAKGNEESRHVINYLREHMPGFENARIASPATELYVRETRHVLAEYQLRMSDIWYERDQWDSIGYGAYPVDIQPYTVNDKGTIISDPVRYAIPFRSLVPLEIENLLVVGRSAGFSSVAFGSARVIPTGMVSGQAAGAASKISIENKVTFREMTRKEELVSQLRRLLKAQGAEVNRIAVRHPYEGEWFDKKIGFLMDYGLLTGGYRNDLRVEDPLTEASFRSLFSNGVKRISPAWHEERFERFKKLPLRPEKTMTRDELAMVLTEFFIHQKSADDAWQMLFEQKWIDRTIFERIRINRPLTRAEGFYTMSLVLQKHQINTR